MDYGMAAMLFLAAATALIVVEIFIPSGGLLAAVTAFCVGAAYYCAYHAWYVSNPTWFWSFAGVSLLSLPGAIIFGFWWLPHTPMGKRLLLDAPDLDQMVPFAQEELRLSKLIGRRCRTLTMLSPGGLISIDGERVHCFSEGMLLEPDTPVEVIKVVGTRVLVRPAPEAEAEAEQESLQSEPPADAGKNEFDFPA